MISVTLNNEQQVRVTLAPQTTKGKLVEVDEPPVWSVLSGGVTVEDVAADGLSATVRSGENPEVSQVLITADADVGEGVVTITETLQVTVNGALAANLGVSVGTPEDKP